ncbi:hypothetical protein [Thioalkalivibrio sp. ALJT]|uniref:hypothetical protein n=1 Tax=Thioalkalivibrio sp. ALJT TaxID=1158146 RepID=UPI00036EEC88|nr:hypothetical protein [Thioalkalivibrio sp. ALJT]
MRDAWDGRTGWRQGTVVLAQELGESAKGTDCERAVVISHDCDLASAPDREPAVEVIPAEPLEHPDGSNQNGRNPRELHLRLVDQEGSGVGWFRLLSRDKLTIRKEALPAGALSGDQVDPQQHHALQDWLAARYRRHALPDALGERLAGLWDHLRSKLRKKGEEIIGIWINYDPREELAPGDPYEIDLYVVFSVDAPGASEVAETLADGLRQRLEGTENLVPGECEALSEEAFTLHDLRTTEQLRFEYISNRLGPDAPRAD